MEGKYNEKKRNDGKSISWTQGVAHYFDIRHGKQRMKYLSMEWRVREEGGKKSSSLSENIRKQKETKKNRAKHSARSNKKANIIFSGWRQFFLFSLRVNRILHFHMITTIMISVFTFGCLQSQFAWRRNDSNLFGTRSCCTTSIDSISATICHSCE